MNVSGIWWCGDVLNGQKPLPPSPHRKGEGFEEVLEKAIEEVNNARTTSRADAHTRQQSNITRVYRQESTI